MTPYNSAPEQGLIGEESPCAHRSTASAERTMHTVLINIRSNNTANLPIFCVLVDAAQGSYLKSYTISMGYMKYMFIYVYLRASSAVRSASLLTPEPTREARCLPAGVDGTGFVLCARAGPALPAHLPAAAANTLAALMVRLHHTAGSSSLGV